MEIFNSSFAGIKLQNPIIIASSGKTNNAQNNLALEKSGAAAIVLKSLFEENILLQESALSDNSDQFGEGYDYMSNYIRSHNIENYINLIRESKQLCSIPIIASINCYDCGGWIEFAKTIEEAGADAIELNIMGFRSSVQYKFGEFEQEHVNIVSEVFKNIKIPIIVKLGSNLTNPVALCDMLYGAGAKGIVMFNRMYQPDIDIEKVEYTKGNIFTTSADLSNPLRWIAISSALNKKVDFALSGGVSDGAAIVKAILAGASAVEVCSVIYKKGNDWIAAAINFLYEWQQNHNYENIDDFKGRLNASNPENDERLMRIQFLKYFDTKK